VVDVRVALGRDRRRTRPLPLEGGDGDRNEREQEGDGAGLVGQLRVPFDQRVLDALAPQFQTGIANFYNNAKTAKDSMNRVTFKKAMEFDRAFAKAGGLLGAGSDPCCISAIAGYGDQRNYELLIEAGFTPEESIQIMTSNGAKILGFDKVVGTIKPGMQADLVLLGGDVIARPANIRNTEIVFRRGIGFDSAKLRESIKGLVGLR